jgi:hypothetical protein
LKGSDAFEVRAGCSGIFEKSSLVGERETTGTETEDGKDRTQMTGMRNIFGEHYS